MFSGNLECTQSENFLKTSRLSFEVGPDNRRINQATKKEPTDSSFCGSVINFNPRSGILKESQVLSGIKFIDNYVFKILAKI
jgi:hypothetical protein